MSNQTESNALPPKTCTIERMITKKSDIDKVLQGQKTATRRNGRYADVGEIMTLEGRDFVVEQVYRQSLGELTDEHAVQEGFSTVEDYKEAILSYHPGMPWLPHMKVWVHEFRPVQE
ncbi:ASCH domain-containing protein [Paenibacillus contaminans]|uniref:ASCH domain-containing protein n=1 Tax=Paenibacillus contaminans TaxID=450362 RepID=A0A329MSX7_9BACL|nr:ASCH domain-containing protein [Paenibacillus contaminans]RAV22904.1 ASCH domain-containing protein [Paenibacillus contaminans]